MEPGKVGSETQKTGSIIRLPDRVPKQKASPQTELETMAYLALKYPQYTIQQLYEDIPAKWLPVMIKVAKRDEAEKLLLLNNIVNGPNAKDKSKSAYKKTIDTLGKLLK